MFAGFREAANNFLRNLRLQFPRCQIVHKKQRGRPLHCDVVHAMIYQVAANGVVHLHVEGHF